MRKYDMYDDLFGEDTDRLHGDKSLRDYAGIMPYSKLENKLDSILFKRFKAMAIDMAIASAAILLIGMAVSFLCRASGNESAAIIAEWLDDYGSYIISGRVGFRDVHTIAASLLYMLRDIAGISPGRRLEHIRVVDGEGGNPPRWKLIVRNISTEIYPVEAVAVLVSKERLRLTDRLLGLRVIKY